MKWLLIYNGDYGLKVAGPEIRYIKLAEQIVLSNEQVTVGVKNPDSAFLPPGVTATSGMRIFNLLKNIYLADVIVLHGGRPLLIFVCALMSVFSRGKRVVLDAYAPHWIELSVGRAGNGWQGYKTRGKITYNIIRTFFCCAVFDGIIVANHRQLDLLRGFMALIGGVDRFSKIFEIPFACDPPVDVVNKNDLLSCLNYQKNGDEFFIGWLGGLWAWMDFSIIAKPLSRAIRGNRKIHFVLFGATEETIEKVVSSIDADVIENIHFIKWIDYTARLKIWSGLDVALVWGSDGIENDYASRTRNFDCLSAGLPIIQNADDDWGPIIIKNNIGRICTPFNLESTIVEFSKQPDLRNLYSKNSFNLANNFSWGNFFATLRSNVFLFEKRNSLLSAISLMFVVLLLPILIIIIFINCKNDKNI
jgi:hypothetical protein